MERKKKKGKETGKRKKKEEKKIKEKHIIWDKKNYKKKIKTIGFPWKRKFYDNITIKNWMKNLQKEKTIPRFKIVKDYHLRNINKISLGFHGDQKYVFIWKDDDYERFNMISDMFQEEERMKCKRKFDRLSPYDFFFSNIDEILSKIKEEKINEFDVREIVYSMTSECSSHRPLNMAFMIDLFVPKKGKVLDPCAGWGDRLAGAISRSSHISEYTGTDPNPNLFEGYENMIKFFVPISQHSKFKMINSRFEEWGDIPKNYYDLVYTSPPYFDFEDYRIKITQKTSEEWFTRFMIVLMKKATISLVKGGILAININQEKGEDYVERLINTPYHNLTYLGVVPYTSSSLRNPQPIWIWQKNK